jgi:DNA-binding transcriptional ArsR family regulator
MAKYKNRQFTDTIAISKALADEQRVRGLLALSEGELCACQLVELLRLAPSTVSKHMSILRQARLVEVRKEGRWTCYRQAKEEEDAVAWRAIEWLKQSVQRSPQLQEDRRRLKGILKIDREELCRIQGAR